MSVVFAFKTVKAPDKLFFLRMVTSNTSRDKRRAPAALLQTALNLSSHLVRRCQDAGSVKFGCTLMLGT